MIFKLFLLCFFTLQIYAIPSYNNGIKITEQNARNILNKIENEVYESVNQTMYLLNDMKKEVNQLIDMLLAPQLKLLTQNTTYVLSLVEKMQSDLQESGQHHIVSLCITYDNINKIKQTTTTLLQNQITVSKRQININWDKFFNETSEISDQVQVFEGMIKQCSGNEDCLDNVVMEARKISDNTITSAILKFQQAWDFGNSLFRFTDNSLNAYVQKAIKDQQGEVSKIEKCIDDELSRYLLKINL